MLTGLNIRDSCRLYLRKSSIFFSKKQKFDTYIYDIIFCNAFCISSLTSRFIVLQVDGYLDNHWFGPLGMNISSVLKRKLMLCCRPNSPIWAPQPSQDSTRCQHQEGTVEPNRDLIESDTQKNMWCRPIFSPRYESWVCGRLGLDRVLAEDVSSQACEHSGHSVD